MRTTIAFALCLAALNASALAQDEMLKPSKEVQKFAPLIGTWKGSGVWKSGPDAPVGEWTSKSTARWVMDGHFVREDLEIDLGESGTLAFANFYGWDRERQRHVIVEVSNLGMATIHEPQWTDDETMVYADSGVMMGQLHVGRWIYKIGDGVIDLSNDAAAGDGKFYEHVRGQMKRTDREPIAASTVNAAFMPDMNTGLGKLKTLADATGTYKIKGWMTEPGQPKTDITGTETIDLAFGGSVLEFRVKGDPIPDAGMPAYEGWGCWAWNDHAQAYDSVWLSNYGEVGSDQVRKTDQGQYIGTTASTWHGQPAARRGVMEMENGVFARYWAHTIVGADEPQKTFFATYEKQ